MIRVFKIYTPALAVFLPALVFAASEKTPAYCTSAAKLQAVVHNCTTNYFALSASLNCVNGLNRAIQDAHQKLAEALARQAVLERSGQQGNLQNSGADLSEAIATLQALLAEADTVRKQVWLYQQVIAFPGFSRGEAAAKGLTNTLSTSFCFRDAMTVVKFDLAEIEQKMKELQTAAVAAVSMGRRTGVSLKHLGAENLEISGAAKTQSLSARIPAGTAQDSGSQITGKIDAVQETTSEVRPLHSENVAAMSVKDALNRAGKISQAGTVDSEKLEQLRRKLGVSEVPANGPSVAEKMSRTEAVAQERRIDIETSDGEDEQESSRITKARELEAAQFPGNAVSVSVALSASRELTRNSASQADIRPVENSTEDAGLDLFQRAHAAHERAVLDQRLR